MPFGEFRWITTPEALVDGTDKWILELQAAVDLLAEEYADKIQTWMQENAIWQDRTGNARTGLYGDVRRIYTQVFIEFGYANIDYGRWLEYAHSGKYSIIGPATDYWAPLIYDSLQDLLR